MYCSVNNVLRLCLKLQEKVLSILYLFQVGDLMRSFKLLLYKSDKSVLEEVCDISLYVQSYSFLGGISRVALP